MPRIDSAGLPAPRPDGEPVDDAGRRSTTPAARSTTTATCSATPTAARCRRRRAAASASIAGQEVQLPAARGRRLVPLLRRQGPQADRLLRLQAPRINGDAALTGYCYARPQGLLRHVLRHARCRADAGRELVLAGAALLIGATGTFSPCGFSVVETLGPTGHTGGRRTTIAACITFLPGAGSAGSSPSARWPCSASCCTAPAADVAYSSPPAIAVLAAVLEMRGTRIVPQIRRQLPEHWRRLMPMPLAAALYGVLLGIGLHHLRPLLRRLGAGRDQPRGRRSRTRPADRALLRRSAARSRSCCSPRRRRAARPARARRPHGDERPAPYLGIRRGDAVALLAGRRGAGR